MSVFQSPAEAADYLKYTLENAGVFVTAPDVLPLIPELFELPEDGTARLALAPGELLTRCLTLLELPEQADCPLSWCTGDRTTHASFNPDEWEHAATDDALAPDGMLLGMLLKVGTAAPFYTLSAESGEATFCTVQDLAALADEFEQHAATLRDRARMLAEHGGIQ
ncbi:hypothetical protein NHL51_04290 [Leucobacter sp. gxy201]|uniref:hypothetical protein n=1 Tax=Leucobacter sp. gxy201 TaxID=2957200 RepID=UPI003DA129CA